MHPSKTLLIYVIFIAFVAIYQLPQTLGKLKITGSYCLLKTENETDVGSPTTVYRNMPRLCDLQINASSSSLVLISIVAGNILCLDYIYAKRIEPISVSSDRFMVWKGPLEPCKVYFAHDIIQLHFRGDIVLGIHDVMVEKDRHPGCHKNIDQVDTVDALEGQTLNCEQVNGFNFIIQCFSINVEWWMYNLDSYMLLPSTKCDMQCSDDCLCILSDRIVIYNCPNYNTQHLNRNFSGFILFSSNISRLDMSKNRITALETSIFTNIGKYIIYLSLSSNLLSSLEVGVFTNLKSLVYLSLHNNLITYLNPGIFDNLHSIVSLDLRDNTITTVSIGLFANLHSLATLDLEKNTLTTLDKGLFADLYCLQDLYINNNVLVSLPSKMFYKLHVLRYLYLYSNQIKYFADETFSNLFKLTRLSLAYNSLSFLQVDLFDDLFSLTHLDLSHNNLQSIPRIGHITFLSQINLFGNVLAKVSQNIFNGVPSTTFVYVDKPEICFCYLNISDTCFYTTKPSPYLTCNRLLSLRLLTISIWTIGCSAFLGNAFVLWWKQIKHKATNKVQSLLLSNLAMSDLLMGVYMIIIASADIYYGEYFPMNAENWRSGIICRFAGTLAITSSEASVLFVTLISVDRFITIRFPYSLYKLNAKLTKMISFMVWTFSLTLGLVASISAGKNSDFYDNSHVCIGLPLTQTVLTETHMRETANINFWEDALTVQLVIDSHKSPGLYFSVAVFVAFNMLCFLLILACYIAIIREVSQTSKAASRQREMAEEIRMTIKVSAIVLTDFSCWFPICLIGVLVQIGLLELPNSIFAWVVTLVLPINSAINPFLYTLVTIINAKCSKETSTSTPVLQSIEMQSLPKR